MQLCFRDVEQPLPYYKVTLANMLHKVTLANMLRGILAIITLTQQDF
jgi:hypothetical protein